VDFDVIIIGAGPAGLFTAYELVKHSGLKILLIEKGLRASKRLCPLMNVNNRFNSLENPRCSMCRPCHIIHGVGGAGVFSSGTINLRPDIGGDLHLLTGSWSYAEELINYIDKVFLEFGAPSDQIYVPPSDRVKEVERLIAKAGAQFIPAPQRVIGSDNTFSVIENMTVYLERNNVKLLLETTAYDIYRDQGSMLVKTSNGIYRGKYVVLAPGRSGASWFMDLARRRGIEVEPGPLDIGVRLEFPAFISEPLTSIVRDPKIILYTRVYDDRVRTFCTNPYGFVVEERYDDGFVLVNGESYTRIKSRNTNLALLVTIKLTDPMENTIEYGRYIARLTTKLGGGKPLIQRFSDLEAGRRSTWDRIHRSTTEPTLRDVTPGDIGMALPYRVVSDIIEAINRLDTIFPGLASNQTLLYAPEIKFYSVKAVINRELETSMENVFAAGDGAGLSRGINVAAATGVLVARSILSREGIDFDRK